MEKKARKPSFLKNNSHKHLKVLQNNISFVEAGDIGRHRCAARVYPGVGDDSMLTGTCKNTCIYSCTSLNLCILLLLLNTDELRMNVI